MRLAILNGVAAGLALLSGCALTYPDPSQTVMIEVRDKSDQSVRAICSVANDRGNWTVIAPGEVTLPKSRVELQVQCQRDGARPSLARVLPSAASLPAHLSEPAQLIEPGGLKLFLDPVRYSTHAYPSRIQLVLGELVIIDTHGRSR